MDYDNKRIRITDEFFDTLRDDIDHVLQRLLKNMVEKGSLDGTVTIKIDCALEQEWIPNFDPEIDGETRKVLRPKFEHKISSMMQIKDEQKGTTATEMELVWDEELHEYVLRPVTGTDQTTIFDVDYEVVSEEVVNAGPEEANAYLGAVLELPPEEDYDYEEPEE